MLAALLLAPWPGYTACVEALCQAWVPQALIGAPHAWQVVLHMRRSILAKDVHVVRHTERAAWRLNGFNSKLQRADRADQVEFAPCCAPYCAALELGASAQRFSLGRSRPSVPPTYTEGALCTKQRRILIRVTII